ncbi:MAG: M12 family metallo-peptidase [Planctomycetota bacterium]
MKFEASAHQLRGVAVLLLLAITSTSTFAQSTVPSTSKINDAFGLKTATTQVLNFDAAPELGRVAFRVELPGIGPLSCELTKHSLRADGFQLFVSDAAGTLTSVTPPEIQTYRGTFLEAPDLEVRASYSAGELRAVVIGPNQSWGIQSLREHGIVAAPGEHVVYRVEDALAPPGVCGVAASGGGAGPSGGSSPFGPGTMEVCEIAVDADFEFYQAKGSSVPATVSDIESVLNAVEAIYEAPTILITYEVTVIVVRTAAGTYTTSDPGSLLNQFENLWESSAPESTISRDVAHLFTGRNLSGSVIGIANLFGICNNQSYGLSESTCCGGFSTRVALTAHELGHNWSSLHCDAQADCRIMCSGLGGCDGLSPLTFEPASVNQILDYKDSRMCLQPAVPTHPLPFVETVETLSISSGRWSYIDGASASTLAVAEPSAPNSVRLNAAGSALYLDDDLRSTFIALGGTIAPQLQYATQHRGVPAGGQLFVEYWASNMSWVVLNTLTSDGVDENVFTPFTHALPVSARHNEFRVRFRAAVSDTSHNWFVDDISVSEGPPPPPAPPELIAILPTTGPLIGGTVITIYGENINSTAQVTVGGQPLVSPQYLGTTEIVGLAPANGAPGAVSVSLSQPSGTDTLPNAYIYSTNAVSIQNTVAAAGGNVDVLVFGSNDLNLSGFSLAVNFDTAFLDIVAVTVAGTDVATAEFVAPNLNNDLEPGTWWTLGVLFDLSPPVSSVLTPGANRTFARAQYAIDPLAFVGQVLPLVLENGVGVPPVDNVFALSVGASAIPTLGPGQISIVATAFVRGDANFDGAVNIADVVANLEFQFAGLGAPCLDALDVNDDSVINIADPIYALNYQFSAGPPPLPPFPLAGVDPTADLLDCF